MDKAKELKWVIEKRAIGVAGYWVHDYDNPTAYVAMICSRDVLDVHGRRIINDIEVDRHAAIVVNAPAMYALLQLISGPKGRDITYMQLHGMAIELVGRVDNFKPEDYQL